MGSSLAVQWLRLHVSNAAGVGSIPGQGTKIPHTVGCGQKRRNHQQYLEMGYLRFYTYGIEHRLPELKALPCHLPAVCS